ncbi:hypothetical protein BGX38DRAFT_462298 [Terfezia claveryi]|nr:hypothetical protein BGX38DRAFT_462298 [Terfezia claveryi]
MAGTSIYVHGIYTGTCLFALTCYPPLKPSPRIDCPYRRFAALAALAVLSALAALGMLYPDWCRGRFGIEYGKFQLQFSLIFDV